MKILFIDTVHPLLKKQLKRLHFDCDTAYKKSKSEIEIIDGDIFVVTQKIVSKSEGMTRNLNEYNFEDLLKSEVKSVVRK